MLSTLTKRVLISACFGLLFVSFQAHTAQDAKSNVNDLVCSYAPSQSAVVTGVSASAGGAAAATVGLAKALGLTAVTHSSGAVILSGSGGYLAGTLGAAIAGPAIVTVAAVVGGTAVSIELLCAPKNHPEGYKAVLAAADKFRERAAKWAADVGAGLGKASSQTVKVSKNSVKVVSGAAKDLFNLVMRD